LGENLSHKICPPRRRNRESPSNWLRPGTCLVGLLWLILPAAGLGLWDEVADLFKRTEYDAARDLLASGDLSAGRSGEAEIWQLLLAKDPDEALAHIAALKATKGLTDAVRQQVVLQEASLHFTRGDYQAALAPIVELASSSRDRMPGELYLLAGLSQWAMRNIQESREFFATIPQSDPAFVWARYYLGCLGLEAGDPTIAQRYFESGQKGPHAERTPSLLAGKWEGLRQQGDWQSAEELQKKILHEYPQSLAALRIHYVLDQEALTAESASPPAEPAPILPTPESARGRISLQLAAFSDRSRALTYLASWQQELPDLRVDEEEGPGLQILYKVRLGHFVSRSQASTEAQRLRRQHGLDALIVESVP